MSAKRCCVIVRGAAVSKTKTVVAASDPSITQGSTNSTSSLSREDCRPRHLRDSLRILRRLVAGGGIRCSCGILRARKEDWSMTTVTKPESLFYSRHMWKSNLDRLRTLAALRSVREQRLVH